MFVAHGGENIARLAMEVRIVRVKSQSLRRRLVRFGMAAEMEQRCAQADPGMAIAVGKCRRVAIGALRFLEQARAGRNGPKTTVKARIALTDRRRAARKGQGLVEVAAVFVEASQGKQGPGIVFVHVQRAKKMAFGCVDVLGAGQFAAEVEKDAGVIGVAARGLGEGFARLVEALVLSQRAAEHSMMRRGLRQGGDRGARAGHGRRRSFQAQQNLTALRADMRLRREVRLGHGRIGFPQRLLGAVGPQEIGGEIIMSLHIVWRIGEGGAKLRLAHPTVAAVPECVPVTRVKSEIVVEGDIAPHPFLVGEPAIVVEAIAQVRPAPGEAEVARDRGMDGRVMRPEYLPCGEAGMDRGQNGLVGAEIEEVQHGFRDGPEKQPGRWPASQNSRSSRNRRSSSSHRPMSQRASLALN